MKTELILIMFAKLDYIEEQIHQKIIDAKLKLLGRAKNEKNNL